MLMLYNAVPLVGVSVIDLNILILPSTVSSVEVDIIMVSPSNGSSLILDSFLNSFTFRIPFTVVSDPVDTENEIECQEIGVAELDILEVR